MKNYNKLLGIFFLWFLLTGLFLGTVVADDDDDEDDDGVDDDVEEHNKRELKIEVEEDQVEFASELRNGDIESSLEIKIKLEEDDGIEIKVKYEISGEDEDEDEEEDDDDVETSSDGIEFEIILHSLIEFVDVDADGIYDPSTDTEIKEVLLNSFNTPEHKKEDLEDDEGTLHEIEITSTDGVFTIRFFITESFTEVYGDTLTPTETKFDIEINNFVYVDGSSQLALMAILESEDDYEHDDETDDEKEGHSDDEEGAELGSGSEQGFFTWKDTAEIDGTTTDVLASELADYEDDEDEQVLYLNYQRGTNILHDPKIGIAASLITDEQPIEYLPFILGTVGIAGIIGFVVIMTKRVKNRKLERI